MARGFPSSIVVRRARMADVGDGLTDGHGEGRGCDDDDKATWRRQSWEEPDGNGCGTAGTDVLGSHDDRPS